jgi:hypothetical protein
VYRKEFSSQLRLQSLRQFLLRVHPHRLDDHRNIRILKQHVHSRTPFWL